MFSWRTKENISIFWLENEPYLELYYSWSNETSLTLSTLGKIFIRRTFWNIFLIFTRKQVLIFYANCMKCQILFSGKNKKNVINVSSAELVQRMVQLIHWFVAFYLKSNKNKQSQPRSAYALTTAWSRPSHFNKKKKTNTNSENPYHTLAHAGWAEPFLFAFC